MLMKQKHGKPGMADAKASRGAHAPSRVPTGALAGRIPSRPISTLKIPEINAIQPCSTLLSAHFFRTSLSSAKARGSAPRSNVEMSGGCEFFKRVQVGAPPSGWGWLSTSPPFSL